MLWQFCFTFCTLTNLDTWTQQQIFEYENQYLNVGCVVLAIFLCLYFLNRKHVLFCNILRNYIDRFKACLYNKVYCSIFFFFPSTCHWQCFPFSHRYHWQEWTEGVLRNQLFSDLFYLLWKFHYTGKQLKTKRWVQITKLFFFFMNCTPTSWPPPSMVVQ